MENCGVKRSFMTIIDAQKTQVEGVQHLGPDDLKPPQRCTIEGSQERLCIESMICEVWWTTFR